MSRKQEAQVVASKARYTLVAASLAGFPAKGFGRSASSDSRSRAKLGVRLWLSLLPTLGPVLPPCAAQHSYHGCRCWQHWGRCCHPAQHSYHDTPGTAHPMAILVPGGSHHGFSMDAATGIDRLPCRQQTGQGCPAGSWEYRFGTSPRFHSSAAPTPSLSPTLSLSSSREQLYIGMCTGRLHLRDHICMSATLMPFLTARWR